MRRGDIPVLTQSVRPGRDMHKVEMLVSVQLAQPGQNMRKIEIPVLSQLVRPGRDTHKVEMLVLVQLVRPG